MDSATMAAWVAAGSAIVGIVISGIFAWKASRSAETAVALQRSQLAMAQAQAGTTLEVFASRRATI